MNDIWHDGPNRRHDDAMNPHTAKLTSAARKLADDPDGQYFLRWLVQGAGVFAAGFPSGHAQAAFTEGQRRVGLAVLQLCVAADVGTILLTKETEHD